MDGLSLNDTQGMAAGEATTDMSSEPSSSPVAFFDVTEISLLTLEESSEMNELISISPDFTTFEPNTTDGLEAALLPPERTLSVAYTVAEAIVSLLAIFGNALVVYIFCKNRSLRRYRNYYIVALAIADFLVGLLGIPFAILASVGYPRNLYGCLFTVSILIVLCTVSILCLVAVSIDRYWATTNPFAYYRNMTTTTAVSIILFCWVAGAIIGFLPMFGWYNREGWLGFPSEYCFFTDVMDYSYLVFLYFATIVFPALLMIGFYGYIYHVVLIKIRQKGTFAPQHLRRFSEQSRQGSLSCENRSATQVLRIIVSEKRREAKAAKKLGIIVVFFMLCWMPLYTINCIQAFYPKFHVPIQLLNFCIILSHANSALNPFLYAYHLKEFRLAMKNALLALCGKLCCGLVDASGAKDNTLGLPPSRTLTMPSLGHVTIPNPASLSVKFQKVCGPGKESTKSVQISPTNNSIIPATIVEEGAPNKDNLALSTAPSDMTGKSLTNLSLSSNSSYHLVEMPVEVKFPSNSSLSSEKISVTNFLMNGKSKVRRDNNTPTHIPYSHPASSEGKGKDVVLAQMEDDDIDDDGENSEIECQDVNGLDSPQNSIPMSHQHHHQQQHPQAANGNNSNAKNNSHTLLNGLPERDPSCNKAELAERDGVNGTMSDEKNSTNLSPTPTIISMEEESQKQLAYSNEQTFSSDSSHLHQKWNAEVSSRSGESDGKQSQPRPHNGV